MDINSLNAGLAILGGSSSGTGGTGSSLNLSATAVYNSLTGTKTQLMNAVNNDPTVKANISYFQQQVGKLTSVNQLFQNPRLVNFLLESQGLSSLENEQGLVQKALSANVNDNTSLPYQLNNPPLLALAQQLKLGTLGLTNLQDSSVQTTIISNYKNTQYQNNVGQENSAVPAAMNFLQNASSFTTPYQILGDPNARQVILTAYGIPDTIAYQPVDDQAATITRSLDIKQLQNPTFVKQLVQRYLGQSDANSAGTSGSATGNGYLLNLFT